MKKQCVCFQSFKMVSRFSGLFCPWKVCFRISTKWNISVHNVRLWAYKLIRQLLSDMRLLVYLPKAVCPVWMRAQLLSQPPREIRAVISNIMSHAVKHGYCGGIALQYTNVNGTSVNGFFHTSVNVFFNYIVWGSTARKVYCSPFGKNDVLSQIIACVSVFSLPLVACPTLRICSSGWQLTAKNK